MFIEETPAMLQEYFKMNRSIHFHKGEYERMVNYADQVRAKIDQIIDTKERTRYKSKKLIRLIEDAELYYQLNDVYISEHAKQYLLFYISKHLCRRAQGSG